MKIRHWQTLFLMGLLTAVSCDQDPIFHTIHKETAPIPPLIKGAPTNMVIFNWGPPNGALAPVLFVASDELFWYAKNEDGASGWNFSEYYIPQPGGKIVALAATKNRLYVLSMDGSSVQASLRCIDRDERIWKGVSIGSHEYPLIQSIYATPEEPWLFAGSRSSSANSHAILYLNDDSEEMALIKGETSMLSSVIHKEGAFYLSTQGSGIYCVDTNVLNAVPAAQSAIVPLIDTTDGSTDSNREFMKMIQLKDTIIAVERSGPLYQVLDVSSFERMHSGESGDWITAGFYTTGAVALWEDFEDPHNPDNRKLLIIGVQGGLYNTISSSHTYGYIEFELNTDGSFNVKTPRRETSNLLSIHDPDRYTASIGKHPINHLFQAPWDIDERLTLFASTQTAGLWSYKDRPDSGGWQWNAEN